MAMTAYAAELDFVYQEGDCLAFGPYVERMYAEIGGGNMIFGNYAAMPCAPSLLSRETRLPSRNSCRREYLALGGDGIEYNLPEAKFAKLKYVNPAAYRRFSSFGYDRARPADGLAKCKDEVWYVPAVDEGRAHRTDEGGENLSNDHRPIPQRSWNFAQARRGLCRG